MRDRLPRPARTRAGCLSAVFLVGFAMAGLCLFDGLLQAQQSVLPLWPQGTPEPAQTTAPERDTTTPADALISGHRTARLTNVTRPTLSVYPPRDHNTGAAALVFPGGGYERLAWDGEGLDTCTWLNSLGMTCLLVKYRVPEPRPDPTAERRSGPHTAPLEDAQQAMRLTRQHAAAWHIDLHRIGVVGFSAGGNLAVLLSTHPDDAHVLSSPAAGEVPMADGSPLDARANFALVIYPAYLPLPPGQTELNPLYAPNAFTPPTFLLQAENDRSYHNNALVYYRALMDAHVPAELHYSATGGHGFGVHPADPAVANWTELAAAWLRNSHILPAATTHREGGLDTGIATPNLPPCTTTAQPPQPGRPDKTASSGGDTPPCY